MRLHSVVSGLSVLIILSTVLVSGPLVSSIDFTRTGPLVGDEESSASISIISSSSESYRISQDASDGTYYLYSSPLTVRASAVRGAPVLVYELQVPGLGHSTAALVFLNDRNAAEEITVNIEPSRVEAEKVSSSTYAASVEVRIRSGNVTREVYRENVTVEVDDIEG